MPPRHAALEDGDGNFYRHTPSPARPQPESRHFFDARRNEGHGANFPLYNEQCYIFSFSASGILSHLIFSLTKRAAMGITSFMRAYYRREIYFRRP